jgi:hypothetical protein
MVTALIHSTQIAEPGDRIEEMKRQNMNLIKKLKKVCILNYINVCIK